MVESCINRQNEAKQAIKWLRPPPEIKAYCQDEWRTDYAMVKYCIEWQSQAKRNLGYKY
ncbi:hypothetical protein EDC39_101309 [Geothermobacter ehrlichii]|uniref:Uncharacterized protein n=1 Tax=Geothermobacter ehrlichii TaxID=213224 RepID=A0A5D3WRD1_9BACT|nr:hypothetical protein EDC39_101309 [Geothermobacter ehrlichii]